MTVLCHKTQSAYARQESVGESRKPFKAFLTGIFAGVSRLRLQAKKQDSTKRRFM